ncbi:MAG: CoA transferase, partial [Flavobacteriales bacterium]|nr:CoA transferase [Flavobacteriales bacterium]
GLNEVPTDHRFATNPERVRNRMALAALLAPAIGSAHRDDLLDQLLRAGVPAGAVRDLAEVMQSPAARAMTLESTIDGQQTRRIRGNAFRIGPL